MKFLFVRSYVVATLCVVSACGSIAQQAVTVAPLSQTITGTSSAGPAANSRHLLYEITHPASWLTWGFDSRNRWELNNNAFTLQQSSGSENSYLRLRNRLWTELRPLTNLTLRARLMTEPKYYFKPDSRQGWENQEGLFDALFLESDGLGWEAMKVRLGRQELQFGDKWIFFDGTTADGSRTEFFDAARFTLNLNDRKTTLDFFGIFNDAETDAYLPVINDQHDLLSEQDERAGVLYASHEFSKSFRLDAHYIYRHMTREAANGDQGDEHIPGVRFSGKPGAKWDYYAETAGQFGQKNGADLLAWGFNGDLGYTLGGSWKHRVHAGYEFLSGDNPDTVRDEGWDPLWGRRARWSELMVFTFSGEAGGKRGYFSNLQRPSVGWSAAPAQFVELAVNYMPMFANTNPQRTNPLYSEDGNFRGHLLQTLARFKLNKYVTACLWNEVFKPGDFYAASHQDVADFFRAEVNFSF